MSWHGFNSYFTFFQLCVGGEDGKDTCIGDSGAPLIISGPQSPPFLQLGIVSFGPEKCGLENMPAVYTSVKHYRSWIEKNLKPWWFFKKLRNKLVIWYICINFWKNIKYHLILNCFHF